MCAFFISHCPFICAVDKCILAWIFRTFNKGHCSVTSGVFSGTLAQRLLFVENFSKLNTIILLHPPPKILHN